MKTFLRKAIVYLLVVYLAGIAIVYLLLTIDPGRFIGYHADFVMWDFQKKAIASPRKVDRNIIIGDSRALADIDPTVMGHSFSNLAIAGASTYEGYLTVKRLLKSRKIDTIMICYGAYHYTVSDNFHDMSLPYNFPCPADLAGLEKVEGQYGITVDNNRPSALRNLNRRLIYYHIPVNNYRAVFVRNLFQRELDPYSASMAKNSGHVLFGVQGSSAELSQEALQNADKSHFYKNPVLVAYLDSIVNLAKEKQVHLLLVPPPLNQATFKVLERSGYLAEYNSFLNSFKQRNALVELIYDHPCLPDSLFGDRSHLNAMGSKYFSLSLKKVLQ